jgi:hypothetical protein
MVPLKDLHKRRATTEPKDEDDSLSVKQEDIKDEGTDPERIDMLEVRPTFDRGYGLSLHSVVCRRKYENFRLKCKRSKLPSKAFAKLNPRKAQGSKGSKQNCRMRSST